MANDTIIRAGITATIIFQDKAPIIIKTGVGPAGKNGDDAAVNALATPENEGKILTIKDSGFAALSLDEIIPDFNSQQF